MTFSTRWQRAIPTVLAPLLLATGCGRTHESAPTGPSLGVSDWAGVTGQRLFSRRTSGYLASGSSVTELTFLGPGTIAV